MKQIIEWIKDSEGVQTLLGVAVLLIVIIPLAVLLVGLALRVVIK